MIEIDILDHNFAILDKVHPWLSELLSYMSETYNSRTKKWKRERMYVIEPDGRFLTGLVPFIQEEAARKRVGCNIKDRRIFPKIEYSVPELTVNLREYQIEYLGQALRNRRMIVDSATGSGKTIMMAALLETLGKPALIIAPNKTVMAQLKTEFSKLLPNRVFGTASGEGFEASDSMIGLSRTLVKIDPNFLRRFKVLMVDDAHTCAASQTMDVILTMNAPYRFGFTGTAKGRSDKRDLVVYGLLGPPIQLVEQRKLMDQGYLAETSVDMHYGNWEGDYNTLEDLLIVNNPKRNELISNIVKSRRGKTILILVRRIRHGEILRDALPGSVFVSGEMSTELREDTRQLVKSGKIKILIASNVYATGLDIPNLDVGINAAGGKAEILTGQKIGRLMRPWNDACKKWIDIFDNYHPLLDKHSRERYRIYRSNNINIDLVRFPPGKKRSVEDMRSEDEV